MLAAKAFTATFNGREYSAKKNQKVDVPPALLAALIKEGIVKKETSND